MPMRKWLLISWLSISSATIARTQVTELWSSGLTNLWHSDPLTTSNDQDTYYYETTATVDWDGNTFVSGLITSFDLGVSSPFIAKFDARGRKLWESEADWPYPDDLAADQRGDVFLSGRLDVQSTNYAVLVKLTDHGQELWRILQPSAGGSFVLGTAEAARQDSQGNSFFLVYTPNHQLSISKISRRGQVLWQRYLPTKQYADVEEGFTKSISMTSDNGVAIAGGYLLPSKYVAFVTKYDANGNALWWSEDFTGGEEPFFYSSVMTGARGTICAAAVARFVTTFSDSGRAIHTDGTIGGQVVATSNDGGFLLRNGGFIYAMNVWGRLQWTVGFNALEDMIGVVPNGRGGWLAAGQSGSDSTSLLFVSVDGRGRPLWQASLGNYPYEADFWVHEYNKLLRAPDGTYRVVERSRCAAGEGAGWAAHGL